MSAAFTITGSDYQLAEKLEELREAYSERISILPWWSYGVADGFAKSAGVIEPANFDIPDRNYEGSEYVYFGGHRKFTDSSWKSGDGTSADVFQGGTVSQYRYFWQEMQQFCSSQGMFFYDSSRRLSPVNNYLAKNFFQKVGGTLYQDDNNWGFRRASSIDPSGFPVFQRGNMRAGDFIGSWIIDDLKACFVQMTGFTQTGGLSFSDSGFAAFTDYGGGTGPGKIFVESEAQNGIAITGATVYIKYLSGTEVFIDYPVGESSASFFSDYYIIERAQAIAHFDFKYGTPSA
jgi:hypothetical protein